MRFYSQAIKGIKLLTVTILELDGSLYCDMRWLIGRVTDGRLFRRLLMCTSSSMTFLRTTSCWLASLSSRGAKNLWRDAWKASSVSVETILRNTRSTNAWKIGNHSQSSTENMPGPIGLHLWSLNMMIRFTTLFGARQGFVGRHNQVIMHSWKIFAGTACK